MSAGGAAGHNFSGGGGGGGGGGPLYPVDGGAGGAALTGSAPEAWLSPVAAAAPGAGGAPAYPASTGGAAFGSNAADVLAALESNPAVPTVFRWEHGGGEVYITGTFNGWSRRVPMHRSGNDFVYIASLSRGKHAFKFVVDDAWRFAPDQPTIADAAGNINNYLDLTSFSPEEEAGGAPPMSLARRDSLPGIAYGHGVPDEDEYTKEPPLLPPHLRQIILNGAPPDSVDPLQLPVPLHVTLGHLFCTAIRDGLMVQATSQRYRRKFVTTVLYTMIPAPGGGVVAASPSGGGVGGPQLVAAADMSTPSSASAAGGGGGQGAATPGGSLPQHQSQGGGGGYSGQLQQHLSSHLSSHLPSQLPLSAQQGTAAAALHTTAPAATPFPPSSSATLPIDEGTDSCCSPSSGGLESHGCEAATSSSCLSNVFSGGSLSASSSLSLARAVSTPASPASMHSHSSLPSCFGGNSSAVQLFSLDLNSLLSSCGGAGGGSLCDATNSVDSHSSSSSSSSHSYHDGIVSSQKRGGAYVVAAATAGLGAWSASLADDALRKREAGIGYRGCPPPSLLPSSSSFPSSLPPCGVCGGSDITSYLDMVDLDSRPA